MNPDGHTLKNKIKAAYLIYKDGKYPEARALYQSILDKNPHHLEAIEGLQKIALKENRYTDALVLIEDTMNLSPVSSVEDNIRLGYVLNKLRRVDESIEAYKKAIKLRPNAANIYHKLAHVYRTNGRFTEAEAAYEKVFKLDPSHINSYYPYSNIHTFSKRDPVIALVEKLLNNPEIVGHARVRLLFTMGKIQDDLGNYADAFIYYKLANDQIAEEESFDIETHNAEIDDLIEKWDEAKILPKKLLPKMTHIPIFIIGMSRSGKSLTEWLLSEHPDITSGGEGDEWYTAINEIFPPDEEEWIGETVKNLTNEQKAEIGRIFQETTASECIDSPYIIHSLPFGYWHVGLMLEIFPESKLIHCVRDTWDNMWISYCKYYQSQNGYSYDWNRLIPFTNHYLKLMKHWKKLYGEKILTVSYEKLCENTDLELKRIFEFCGIQYHQPPQLQLSTKYIGKFLHYRPFLEEIVGKAKITR